MRGDVIKRAEGVRYIIESTEESIHIFIELVDIEEVGEMLECHIIRRSKGLNITTDDYSFKRVRPKSVGVCVCDEYVGGLIRDYRNEGKDICGTDTAGTCKYDDTRMYHVSYVPGSSLMHIKGGEAVVVIANGVFKTYVSDVDGNNARWIDKKELVYMSNS